MRNETQSEESKIISTNIEERIMFLKCHVLLQETEPDSEDEAELKEELQLSFVFEDGTGGKQAQETLKQYIINRLNIREHILKSNPKKRKRKKTDNKSENSV